MNLTPTNLIIIVLVCGTIGYIAGVMITNFRSGKTGSSGQSAPVEGSATSPDGLVDVVRLVREDPRGPIQVMHNEKYFHLASEMNRKERDFIEEATVELLTWLGYSPSTGNTAKKSLENCRSGEIQVEDGMVSAVEAGPGISSIYTTKDVVLKPVDTIHGLSTEPASKIALPLVNAPPPIKEAPKSIVSQINDILQVKIENTPYALRGIQLTESLNGVVVQVGLKSYPDINAVPDEEIRSLIRASAAEWEKRAGR